MTRERTPEAEKAHRADTNVDIDRAREIALNKLLTRLADIEVEPHEEMPDIGLVEKAVLAVERVEQLERDLEATNEQLDELNDRLDEHEQLLDALGDITQDKTTKEQKVAAIVRFADQKRDNDNDVMRVIPREIKGLLDVSQRYAYQLVEDIAQKNDWAQMRDPRTQATGKDGGGRQRIKKALEIDFEGVHGDSVPLNKFNNDIAVEGVSA